MKLGCTYLQVKNMKVACDFYEQLLQVSPTIQTDRWCEFHVGNCFALYDPSFDQALIEQGKGKEHFNESYLKTFTNTTPTHNEAIILNFYTEDIKQEYERIQRLTSVSELYYVNVMRPYWYFNIKDPDGNLLEIASM